MLAAVLMTIDEGGCVTNETEIGGGPLAVIVIVADMDFVLSVTEVAVIVTVAGVGTALGAV
jgi:hypothetical protein